MSYLVFALKWRPKNFDQIVGQQHIITTLKSAIEKNRLAHAYLFAGPRGVGKTSTARILAKALNCKTGPTVEPCGECFSCQEIAQGRSLDVLEIDGASNRGIEEIRTLRENIKFSPAAGKYKIYIIDEVHMLTQEAFNALLKTLEEPPEFVKFVFATTAPHKVIPTVLSRCQRFDFRRIPVMETIAQLQKIVAAEKASVDNEVLLAIAKSSDGSLRDAESVLDQLISFSSGRITLGDVNSMLGLIEQDFLFGITDAIIRQDAKAAVELLNSMLDSGKDAALFFTHLIGHYRNLMVAKVTQGDNKLIDLPQEVCERLVKQAGALTLEEIFSAFQILINTQDMARRLESSHIPLEISIIRLASNKKSAPVKPPHAQTAPSVAAASASAAAATPAAPVTPIKKTYHHPSGEANAVKEKGTGPHAARTVVKTVERDEPDNDTPVDETAKTIAFEDVQGAWGDIMEELKKTKISVSTYLNEGTLLKIDRNVLTISFPKDLSFHKEAIETKENKALIEKTISARLNAAVRVNFYLSSEKAQKTQDNYSYIKSALEAFNGKVVNEES